MEDNIQASIVKWFTNNYCLKFHNPQCCIFAVPNGGKRNKIEAMKMISTGTLAGVSDLIVIIPNKVIFVEIKTKKGIQSDKQKEFENTVSKLGFKYKIIRSLNDFIDLINKNETTFI